MYKQGSYAALAQYGLIKEALSPETLAAAAAGRNMPSSAVHRAILRKHKQVRDGLAALPNGMGAGKSGIDTIHAMAVGRDPSGNMDKWRDSWLMSRDRAFGRGVPLEPRRFEAQFGAY